MKDDSSALRGREKLQPSSRLFEEEKSMEDDDAAPLSREKLQSLRQLFESAIEREILAGMADLWAIQKKRIEVSQEGSSVTKSFTVPYAEYIKTGFNRKNKGSGKKQDSDHRIISRSTSVGIGFDTVVGPTYTFSLETQETNSEFANLDFELFKTCVCQMSSDAWLAFEYLVALLLPQNPESEVLLLARILGRRVVNYLRGIAEKEPKKFNRFDLMSSMFESLFRDHDERLDKRWYGKKITGRNGEKFTIEGLIYRSAILVYDTSSASRYGEKPSSLYNVSSRLFLDSQPPPKCYFLTSSENIKKMSLKKLSKTEFALRIYDRKNYYPSIYLATAEDVLEYDRFYETGNKISFFEYIVKKIIPAWKHRVLEIRVNGADLKYRKLFGDYSNIDFSGTNFSGAIFCDALFVNAKMVFANLSQVTCRGRVNFNGCNMRHSDLLNIRCEEATTLQGAILVGANINIVGVDSYSIEKINLEVRQQQAEEQSGLEKFYQNKNELSELLDEKAKVIDGMIKELPGESAKVVREQVQFVVNIAKELNANLEVLRSSEKRANISLLLAVLAKAYAEIDNGLSLLENQSKEIAAHGVRAVAASHCDLPPDASQELCARAALIMIDGGIPKTMEKFVFDLLERLKGTPVLSEAAEGVNFSVGYSEKLIAESALLMIKGEKSTFTRELEHLIENARESYSKGKAAFNNKNFNDAYMFFQKARSRYKTDVLGYVGCSVPENYKGEANSRLAKMKKPDGKYSSIKLSK